MSRRVSIVGNGSFSHRDAAIIDHCDLVVRFNDCRSLGEGGWRTDVVAICNTGRPAASMIRTLSWREHPAVASASEFWCVRDVLKFAELKPNLDPELDDFCDDYTAEFAMFAAKKNKTLRVIPRHHHDRIDDELRSMSPDKYIVPSSGMMAIAYLLGHASSSGDEMILAGFDHTGWEGHPFAAERMLVDRYVAEGLVQRIETLHPKMSNETAS